ncbi:MAG: MarR family transcriptional regulator [Alphaproteobacteria bacterium]|nr:MarR family transcriptional regulator [Alphaproteobacteria bacterium]
MSSHTPEGETLTDLILEVFQLNGDLIAAGNQLTQPMGLTSARWQVMGAIALAGIPLTVAQIARRMGLTRQGVQRLVNELSALKLLELSDNPDHRRAKLVTLSAEGSQVFERVDTAQISWVNNLPHGVSEKDLRLCLRVLGRVRSALHDDN